MKFNTKNPFPYFHFGEEELRYLINNIKQIQKDFPYWSDPINWNLNIISSLLILNEKKTFEFLDGIIDDYDFAIICPTFAEISGLIQSKEFIVKIKEISERFKESKWYEPMLEHISFAEKAMNNKDESST
jgi:hypothetical protein